MNEQPAITIVIPCYNYGQFLGDALDTVLAQDFSNWECIVVDDGSTDDSLSLATKYAQSDPRIRVIHQNQSGVCAARNAALKAAKGEFIQLLDADDGIAPSKLRIQHEYLQRHPEAVLVYGDTRFFSKSMSELKDTRAGKTRKYRHLRRNACGEELLHMLVQENFIEISCPLFRKSMLGQTGLFDPRFKSYEDWQFWFHAARAGFCFHYLSEEGTETWIRYGHPSLMSQLQQMNASGIQFRKYMQPALSGYWAWYNRYRRLRLHGRKLLLSLTH